MLFNNKKMNKQIMMKSQNNYKIKLKIQSNKQFKNKYNYKIINTQYQKKYKIMNMMINKNNTQNHYMNKLIIQTNKE